MHQITEWLRYRSATEPLGRTVLTTIGNIVTSVGPLNAIQLFTTQCGSVASMHNHPHRFGTEPKTVEFPDRIQSSSVNEIIISPLDLG